VYLKFRTNVDQFQDYFNKIWLKFSEIQHAALSVQRRSILKKSSNRVGLLAAIA